MWSMLYPLPRPFQLSTRHLGKRSSFKSDCPDIDAHPTDCTAWTIAWLVGWEITSLFSTKIGNIGDKVSGGDLVLPG